MATSTKQYMKPEKHVFNTTCIFSPKGQPANTGLCRCHHGKNILLSCQNYINVLHKSSHDLPSQAVNIRCFLNVTS